MSCIFWFVDFFIVFVLYVFYLLFVNSVLRYCYPKEHGQKPFQLTKVNDDNVTMAHSALFQSPEEIHVVFADLKKWKVTKSQMPLLCPEETARLSLPEQHSTCQEELTRLSVANALHACYQCHALAPKQVAFALYPMALYTQQSFKKKQLKLVPLGTVTKAKEGLQSKLRIQCQGMAFTICAWKQSTDFNDEHCLVPFFGAKPATEEEAVTLEWSHVAQDSISIPILTNPEALGKHQLLLYPKESQEKETSGDTKQPPKKKSRK